MDIDILIDIGDFWFMDRKVCDEMKRLKEKNFFVRGFVSWVGFKQIVVEYVCDERFVGEIKYLFKKMLKFLMDGIMIFFYKLLKLVSYVGMLMLGVGFLYMFIVLYLKLFIDSMIIGWLLFIVI